MSKTHYTLGIISDTHGVVPPQVHEAFHGVDEIIHAGDIGTEDVLIELGIIAPVRAVYGNMDGHKLIRKTAKSLEFDLMGFHFYVSHIECLKKFGKPTICITGHTHAPRVDQVGAILYINPGSAGRPPAGLDASAALLTLVEGKAEAKIISLRSRR